MNKVLIALLTVLIIIVGIALDKSSKARPSKDSVRFACDGEKYFYFEFKNTEAGNIAIINLSEWGKRLNMNQSSEDPNHFLSADSALYIEGETASATLNGVTYENCRITSKALEF